MTRRMGSVCAGRARGLGCCLSVEFDFAADATDARARLCVCACAETCGAMARMRRSVVFITPGIAAGIVFITVGLRKCRVCPGPAVAGLKAYEFFSLHPQGEERPGASAESS